jgi:hypothetical protein
VAHPGFVLRAPAAFAFALSLASGLQHWHSVVEPSTGSSESRVNATLTSSSLVLASTRPVEALPKVVDPLGSISRVVVTLDRCLSTVTKAMAVDDPHLAPVDKDWSTLAQPWLSFA